MPVTTLYQCRVCRRVFRDPERPSETLIGGDEPSADSLTDCVCGECQDAAEQLAGPFE